MTTEHVNTAKSVPYLNRGYTQVIITGIIAFCCPGFFNAMAGLGGAGNANPSANVPANVALYSCFAVFGYLGGFFFNLLGPRVLMAVGGITYAFYALAAYISGHIAGTGWLFITAGAVLGFGAGWLWTAQGALMMAYAPENRKGHYITVFWVIFNLGGFIGGLIQFALNFNTESGTANAASYFVFVAVMTSGSIAALFLLRDPATVVLEDGTKAVIAPAKGAKEEFTDALSAIFDKNMLLLLLLFFGSNYFYTYVFNCVNGVLFNIRTRGLNSSLYWLTQMVGALCTGKILDNPKLSLSARAKRGFWFVVVMFNITYGLGAYLQFGWEGGYDRYTNVVGPEDKIDFLDSNYWFPAFVYAMYGFGDSIVQTYAYWVMGAIAGGNTTLAARYTGLYKGVQSLGAALAWMMDMEEFRVPYTTQFIICWAIFVIAMPTTYIATQNIGKDRQVVDATPVESAKGEQTETTAAN